MRKIYLPLLKEQKERKIYFSSTLSEYRFETTETTRHEISIKDYQEDLFFLRYNSDMYWNNYTTFSCSSKNLINFIY